MVNEQLIKSILFPENIESQKIQYGDFISSELIDLMATSTQARIRECFAIAPDRQTGVSTQKMKYYIEFECASCHSYSITEMGKDEAIYYIAHRNKKAKKRRLSCTLHLCEKCAELEADRQKKQKQELINNKKDETWAFIKTYLNAGWDFKEPSHDDFYALSNAISWCDQKEIAEYIKKMDYKDFLDTPYWKAIARHVKYKAQYKCMLCGKGGLLNVHHRDYLCHGYELQRWKYELICLCNDCHKKHHSK